MSFWGRLGVLSAPERSVCFAIEFWGNPGVETTGANKETRLTILTIGYWVVHATNHARSSHEMLSIGAKESQASNAEISMSILGGGYDRQLLRLPRP